MKELFDVVISGSGPSGSILGYLLSSNGYSVLIIDKEEFPRYKVCAGGIQVKAAELIPFNIDSQIHNEIRKIHFQRRTKDGFLGEYDEPLMYTLDRESFDSYLVEKAIGAGCTIRTGEKVKDISVDNNEVTVFTDKGKYYGKIFTGSRYDLADETGFRPGELKYLFRSKANKIVKGWSILHDTKTEEKTEEH